MTEKLPDMTPNRSVVRC